jgi:hypothetical protein
MSTGPRGFLAPPGHRLRPGSNPIFNDVPASGDSGEAAGEEDLRDVGEAADHVEAEGNEEHEVSRVGPDAHRESLEKHT